MRTSTGSPRLGSRMRCTGSSVSRAAELLAVTISSVLHTDFDSIQKPRLVVKYCCAEFPRGGKLSRDGGILRDGLDAQAVEHVKHAGAEVVTQLAGLLYGFYRSDIPNLDVLADFVAYDCGAKRKSTSMVTNSWPQLSEAQESVESEGD